MSKHGTAGLYVLAPGTTVNGLKCVQLLQKKPNIHMFLHNTSILIHNGVPCHGLKVVLKYLWKSMAEVLDWPGNTSDLNPLENLWSYVKIKVAEKQQSSAKELVNCNCNKKS